MKRRGGQCVVEQDSGIAIGCSDATQRRKARRKAVIVRGRINNGGAGDGPKIGDAGSLIRGHSSAKQVRDSDRSDDQYDGDDDQKLDQRKTGCFDPAPSSNCDFSRTFFSLY